MTQLIDNIYRMGIVPVVVINDAAKAVPLASALYAGGIRTMEITFRTDAAEQAIKNLVSSNTGMLIGAGTITNVNLAKKAIDAGAKYIVSPGFNPKVVQWCIENNIPVIPGINTPSQIEQVMEMGIDTMKFFPAEQSGGVSVLKTYATVYKARFLPTGGVSMSNMNNYLHLKNVVAVGGSWICPEKLIDSEDYPSITLLCKQSINEMHGFQIQHIGINCPNENVASDVSNSLCAIFDSESTETSNAYYINNLFEVLKIPFFGKNGHIGISVNNLDRAIQYFTEKGVEFNYDTYQSNTIIYFKNEVAGFAIHLSEIR